MIVCALECFFLHWSMSRKKTYEVFIPRLQLIFNFSSYVNSLLSLKKILKFHWFVSVTDDKVCFDYSVTLGKSVNDQPGFIIKCFLLWTRSHDSPHYFYEYL